MLVKKISLPDNECGKRQIIKDNFKRQVLINDMHYGWCHALLLREEDKETYWADIQDARGERRLHYHDLEDLMVIESHSKYLGPHVLKRSNTGRKKDFLGL